MDFLGIKDSTASRPSLISSIWSLQVQPQQDATTIVDIQMGSQQSLPELLTAANQMSTEYSNTGIGAQDQLNQLRPSKSLSELSQFCKDSRMFQIHEAPSFVWRRQSTQQQPQLRSLQQQDLSRQQKERNICEWLEQLNCNEDQQKRQSAVSPTTNFAFSGQLGSPASALSSQKPPKPTAMQH
ncbi:hypothetical protein M3Y97_00913200 [Aphelenchoides bicaudatus]|nr:hypothetical protein M3Y97_00913200 [Aphelenchoides bicaudatus]